MTLMQLRYFQTLAGTLNYTKAAEALHISQPSLSYAIAQLEGDLNVALFEKKNKLTSLTPYGAFFLNYVNRVLATLEEGVRMTREMVVNPEGSSITIGCFYSISTGLIPSIVEDFKKTMPDSGITFHFAQHMNSNLLAELKSGRIDLAFLVAPDRSVECAKIGEQMLYVVVPNRHRLAGYASVRVHDLAEEKIVLLHKSSGLRATVEKLFFDEGIPLNVAYETQECNSALQFVTISDCVTIIPLVPAIQLQPVVAIPLSNQNAASRPVFLAWRKNETLPPAVCKVRDFILEERSDLSADIFTTYC